MPPIAINAFALGCYFTAMIMVGIYHVWQIVSSDEYLIGSWRVSFWEIVGTTLATWAGASVFFGFVGMGFETGLNGFFYWVVPGCLFTIIFVHLYGRALRRLQLYTMADVFAVRFGKKAALLPALIHILVYSIPTLALQFIGFGISLQVFFGMELQQGIVISFFAISLYTLMGGLPTTILTDCIQAVLIIIASVLMLVFGIHYAGGIGRIIEITPTNFWYPFGSGGPMSFLKTALTIGPFYMVWQVTWQRIYAARDEKTAVSGVIWGFILALLVGLNSFLTGICARGYIPHDTLPDFVTATAIANVFPPVVGALVVVGLASAVMSSADSFTMMGSSSIARDIYQQYYRPGASDREMLIVSRWSVALMSVLALIFALKGWAIIPMYSMVVETCGAGLVFPVLGLLLWRRTTRAGVTASMLSGSLVTVLWHLAGSPWIFEAVPGYITSLVVLVGVSLCTRHAPDEQVKAAYFEELDVTGYNQHFKDAQRLAGKSPWLFRARDRAARRTFASESSLDSSSKD
ncbi:MAG: sodium:solute symporter family protein [Syntrophobacteraceae bacterium]|nr:sodium:solute symporter family protein [Desulfobacteraceae bacterium]